MDDTTNTAVEAPESHAEAPEASGVGEGTDMVSRAEYDALMAAFTDYRVNTIRVATKYGNQAGGCSVVDKAIKEIDPVMTRATFGATATVTIRVTVKQDSSREPVNEDALWNMIGNAVYDLGGARGRVNRVNDSVRHMEIIEAFSMTDTSQGTEVPAYISPAEYAQREKAQERARWAERQAKGDFGQCDECGKNLTQRYECSDADCDRFIERDEDGARVYRHGDDD